MTRDNHVLENKGSISERIEQEEKKGLRKLTGPLGFIAHTMAILLPIYSFLFIMDLFGRCNIFLFGGTHNAIFLAALLALVFLMVPGWRAAPIDRVPWYDLVLAVLSVIGNVYIAVNYESVVVSGGMDITAAQLALGATTILVLFEAIRRTLGWTMVIIATAFLIHAKYAYLLSGMLTGPEFDWARVIHYVYLSNQGIYGMVLGITTTMIIAFITFGGFLLISGVGEVFLKTALALLGHVRGGGGKVAIVGSALLGTLTGSPMAEIGVVGTITIPLMKRIGYSPTFAGAVEATAACGGVIDPPVMGAVAFVMADFTGIGYGRIALAAVLPAILYYLSLYFQLDLRAAATGLKGLPKSELPTMREALGNYNWVLFTPLAFMIFVMMIFMWEPTVSAYWSIGLLIVICLIRPQNRLNVTKVVKALENSSYSMIDITPITAVAGIIVGSITLTGLGLNLSSFLVTLAGGNLLFLALLTGAAIYIMGMGVSAIATYILMAVLVVPAMTQLGVAPLVAHFFVFYVGVSMFITPPFAPAAYMAASIAGADPFRVGYVAMRLAIVAYLVPFISLYQPALLGVGGFWEIVLAIITSIPAVYALSVGFEGYCLTRTRLVERLGWLICGLLLFVPSSTSAVPGALLFLGLGVVQWYRRKRLVKKELTEVGL
ncbi:MAG: transporter, fusion protein [Deltaproteobacteria bacterium]|nr:transporter, fusion protein [Deltaproteobacteria bacterium]